MIGGGKFANGAWTAAFQHLLNAEARDKYRDSRSLRKILVDLVGTQTDERMAAVRQLDKLVGMRTSKSGRLSEVAKYIDQIEKDANMGVIINPDRYEGLPNTLIKNGFVVISYNPNDTDAIVSLAHEFWHARNLALGLTNNYTEPCGVNMWHFEAYRAQNQVAYEVGIDLQTKVHNTNIPESDKYVDK